MTRVLAARSTRTSSPPSSAAAWVGDMPAITSASPVLSAATRESSSGTTRKVTRPMLGFWPLWVGVAFEAYVIVPLPVDEAIGSASDRLSRKCRIAGFPHVFRWDRRQQGHPGAEERIRRARRDLERLRVDDLDRLEPRPPSTDGRL